MCSVEDSVRTLWRVEHASYDNDDVEVTGQPFEWDTVNFSGKSVQVTEQVSEYPST